MYTCRVFPLPFWSIFFPKAIARFIRRFKLLFFFLYNYYKSVCNLSRINVRIHLVIQSEQTFSWIYFRLETLHLKHDVISAFNSGTFEANFRTGMTWKIIRVKEEGSRSVRRILSRDDQWYLKHRGWCTEGCCRSYARAFTAASKDERILGCSM